VISGLVSLLHATVSVPFRLPNRPDIAIEFVIDTGFTDFLCLPPEVASVLGLPFEYNMRVNLADNSNVAVRVHKATILWNSEEQDVRVLSTGSRPLLGTALLEGYELVVQFTEGGLVTIEEL
jgi:clan AA aspartic protease